MYLPLTLVSDFQAQALENVIPCKECEMQSPPAITLQFKSTCNEPEALSACFQFELFVPGMSLHQEKSYLTSQEVDIEIQRSPSMTSKEMVSSRFFHFQSEKFVQISQTFTRNLLDIIYSFRNLLLCTNSRLK